MSVVAPIYFSATLVTNLILFGFIFGLEYFDRIKIIGTYVITIGCILLQVVGPGIQEDQDDIVELLLHPSSFIWFILLLLPMTVSTILMLRTVYEEKKQIIILLICRSTSYTLNLTVSRAFLLNPTYFILITFVIIKIVSGSIYTYAIVVQSTTVTQSKFVPLNATSIILVNAITGIIIWQDWRVVSHCLLSVHIFAYILCMKSSAQDLSILITLAFTFQRRTKISSWTGYICVFLLLALGCDLLLSANLLTNDNPEYGSKKRASIIIESTPLRAIALVRSDGSRNLYENIPTLSEAENGVRVHNYLSRTESMNQQEESRRDAWKSLIKIDVT